MPFARTRVEGMIVLGDVFWGRVNSCRADHSVSFRVGGAAVALIIVGGLDDIHFYYTHNSSARHCAVGSLSVSRRSYVP